jgi:hypothetical protein
MWTHDVDLKHTTKNVEHTDSGDRTRDHRMSLSLVGCYTSVDDETLSTQMGLKVLRSTD